MKPDNGEVTFDQAIEQIMKSLGCSRRQAIAKFKAAVRSGKIRVQRLDQTEAE
jgi:hypothetical protein